MQANLAFFLSVLCKLVADGINEITYENLAVGYMTDEKLDWPRANCRKTKSSLKYESSCSKENQYLFAN